MSKFKNNNWLTQQPIAHRGLHDGNIEIPENSMAAFAKAITHKYPIELDIQVIKDDTIIVFHDTDLQRVCDASRKTKSLLVHDLQKYHLFKTAEKIPTLIEVLDFVKGQVPLLIELKTETLNKTLERNLLELLKGYKGDFALQSFNPFSVKWLQKHSTYCIGQLAEASLAPKPFNKIVEYIQLNRSQQPDFVAYDIDLFPNPVLSYFKSKEVPVLAWTARSQQQVDQKSVYLDNIIFEGFIPDIRHS